MGLLRVFICIYTEALHYSRLRDEVLGLPMEQMDPVNSLVT